MDKNNDQDSGIKRLEKRLYGNKPIRADKGRASFSPIRYDVKNSWDEGDGVAEIKSGDNGRDSILKTLLTFSIIFFIVAVGVSAYFWLGGGNVISSDNIDLSISGPVSVRGGDQIDLQIAISNKNSIALQSAELLVEYPIGTKLANSSSTISNREIIDLGVVPQASVINKTAKAILFGAENSEQQITVTLQYRTEGSNATFTKEKSYKTFISSSPLSLVLNLPPDTSSGKDLSMDVQIDSNSGQLIKDLILELAYPPGFVFKDATPPPSYGDNSWQLGDLLARGERTVHLRGSIQGQDGEIKTFRASAGTRDNADQNNITLLYGSSLKSLVVKKPFIDLTVALNGDTAGGDYVAGGSDVIRGDIGWVNNLPTQVLNGQLSVKIDGVLLDKSSVDAGHGFFSSSDGVVLWSGSSGSFPQAVEPGQSGSQSLSFSFLPLVSGSDVTVSNPTINIQATFRGTKTTAGAGGSDSVVESIVSRKIKILSSLQLGARAVYYVGPFANSGPLPPIRDKETTYTIIWTAQNSSNDVGGATVKATLPSYVRWIGNISPQTEDLSYNSIGGQITWNIGQLPAGSGVTSTGRQVAFQVGLTPSVSQVGQIPTLISDATISGNDTFVGADIKSVRHALSIGLDTDPSLRPGDNGIVR